MVSKHGRAVDNAHASSPSVCSAMSHDFLLTRCITAAVLAGSHTICLGFQLSRFYYYFEIDLERSIITVDVGTERSESTVEMWCGIMKGLSESEHGAKVSVKSLILDTI